MSGRRIPSGLRPDTKILEVPMKRTIFITFAVLAVAIAAVPAKASEAAIETMQEYMEFAPCEAGIILPRQLTEEVFNDFLFIDALVKYLPS